MFTRSLSYPRTGTDAVKTLLIGGVLTLFGFLVIPLVFVGGYTVRVVRAVLDGDDQAPTFTNPRALFGDGLKALVVGIVYFAVPSLVLAVTGLLTLVLFESGSVRIGVLIALAGMLVAGVLSLVFWYVGAAGFVNFAASGRLGDAFSPGDLWPVLTSSRYATSWLGAVAVFLASSVVSVTLEFVPVVGTALGALVLFYATVAMTYLHARGYDGATTVVESPSPASATQPAD